MKSEVMYEGIDLDAAKQRIERILGPNRSAIEPFTLPEVPAAVQEAGDKAFLEAAAARHPELAPPAPKKRRADFGKPRPKPQPVPSVETHTGVIISEKLGKLMALNQEVEMALVNKLTSERVFTDAVNRRATFIDSLAK